MAYYTSAGAGVGGGTERKRTRYERLRSQLELERASFLGHWRDLSSFITPRRSRFFVSDANKGDRRTDKIVDSTATLASRTLSSGMMAGVTSPARPWFRLTTPDPELAELGPVKDWLHVVTQRMAAVLLRSNIYNTLPMVYNDLGTFATAPMLIEEDFEDVIRTRSFPVGSYMIATNFKGKVNVFFREFQMTVRQIVEEFAERNADGSIDWTNLSLHVKSLYGNFDREAWVYVCHVIYPNDDYDPDKSESKRKKYASAYYEKGVSSNTQANYITTELEDKYLRESGYDYFPVLCPRWEVTGEDVYGTNCPGITALGDVKQLQIMERRGAQAIEKMVNPPMTGPSHLRTQKASILPGDITYMDVREGQQGFRPVHEVRFDINQLEAKEDQIRGRIRRAYYEDLFLMLALSDRRQITAREIEERHEEKLLALGPVLEQLNQDLLDPLIDIVFDIMNRQGLIPEPPEELQGMQLKVEYVSVLSQAQKLTGLAGMERFAGFVGQLAAGVPSVLDKVDWDQMVDEYGDIVGVPPRTIVPDEEVAEIRARRAEAQQAAQVAEAVQGGAKAAKDLASAKMDDKSALTELLAAANAGQLS